MRLLIAFFSLFLVSALAAAQPAQNTPDEDRKTLHDMLVTDHPVDEMNEQLQTMAKSCQKKRNANCVNTIATIVTTRALMRLNCVSLAPALDLGSPPGMQVMGECMSLMYALDRFSSEVFGLKLPKTFSIPIPLPPQRR